MGVTQRIWQLSMVNDNMSLLRVSGPMSVLICLVGKKMFSHLNLLDVIILNFVIIQIFVARFVELEFPLHNNSSCSEHNDHRHAYPKPVAKRQGEGNLEDTEGYFSEIETSHECSQVNQERVCMFHAKIN